MTTDTDRRSARRRRRFEVPSEWLFDAAIVGLLVIAFSVLTRT